MRGAPDPREVYRHPVWGQSRHDEPSPDPLADQPPPVLAAARTLPPFESRKHLPSRLARLRELDGRASILQRGQGTEFDSLREYVPGDDVRSIDWRGTARSNTVVVRTWRPERDRHVLIVLDTGRTSAGRVVDQPRLDHAMDAALLLAVLAARAGDRVDLLAIDRDVRVRILRTSASEVLPTFVDALAGIDPVLVETDYRLLVVGGHCSGSASAVWWCC